jgi:hypothetical protein
MIKPNNRAISAKGKTSKLDFSRRKCTPIGAALRLGFKGFRRFKRFRGLWWRRSPQVIAAWRRQRGLSAAKTFTTGLSPDGNALLSPPIGGTSPKGKHVTGFSVVYDSLRIQFLCHPGGGSLLSAFLPASTCHPERQRRISVKAEYETNAIKYRSAGRSHLQWLFPPLVPSVPPSHPRFGWATKRKRLNGQARRLISPNLHILCRMCTVGQQPAGNHLPHKHLKASRR